MLIDRHAGAEVARRLEGRCEGRPAASGAWCGRCWVCHLHAELTGQEHPPAPTSPRWWSEESAGVAENGPRIDGRGETRPRGTSEGETQGKAVSAPATGHGPSGAHGEWARVEDEARREMEEGR